MTGQKEYTVGEGKKGGGMRESDDSSYLGVAFILVFLVVLGGLIFTRSGGEVLDVWRDASGSPRVYQAPDLGLAYSQGVHRQAWQDYWAGHKSPTADQQIVRAWIDATKVVINSDPRSVRFYVMTNQATRAIAQSMFWLEQVDSDTYQATPKPWVIKRLKKE